MQINYFAYYPDKWPSWPLAWQSWLLSFSTVLLLDYQCPRKFCWKLLSCILNSHKMQNKPVPVSGRRDPTAPGWDSWVKPLPFPLPPKNPCIVSTMFEGLQTRSWVLDGFWRHSNKGRSWGQVSFSYKLLQGKLPLWQFSQSWKWVGSSAPSQLFARMGRNTQLEPHEGKRNY